MKTSFTKWQIGNATALLALLLTAAPATFAVPAGMSLIPAGSFIMGNCMDTNEGFSGELPLHTVYVGAFYMDQYLVTKSQWDDVYQWATNHGYSFDNAGLGKAANHPVVEINWYDCVKWCNARSEKEGLTPCYYTDASQTTVYRSGDINPTSSWVNWMNDGYRLPTETEWEKAARGGLSGNRFPWGDTISFSQANYFSCSNWCVSAGQNCYSFPYDLSAAQGRYNPTFDDGVFPCTSPVGYFAPNGYGLYDMAGNVYEWCWDWWDDSWYGNPGATQNDTRGPAASPNGTRIVRGGSWTPNVMFTRCAMRGSLIPSDNRYINCGINDSLNAGLRCVRCANPLQDTLNTQLLKPVFGNYPIREPGKDSLIVITHGWYSLIFNPPIVNPPDLSWIDHMSNSINQYLVNNGLTNWQVYGYKWLDNSWKVSAPNALSNAKQEGLNLGSAIAVQGWSHVHLIGHSAGAELIQEASQWIKVMPDTTVQCTFLDAYVGNDCAGITNYGKGTDWSDNYFARDGLTGSVTEGCLSNAYNVDVTLLDPHKIGNTKFFSSETGEMETCYKTVTSHGWPIDFYTNTIVGNVNLYYEGFGFPLSKEAGNWDFAKNNYPTGNVPAHVLGVPDPSCISDIQVTPTTKPDWTADFTTLPTVKSVSGSVQKWIGSLKLNPGSPVWSATTVNPTNPVNTVSFDAEFVSVDGSDSLLSVYWDTNVIGTMDEQMVQSGFQHYSLSFPNATANSTHILGFRLDPYMNALSSVILTNVVLKQVGVSQPFSLSVTTNTFSGLTVFQLAGEAGFNYSVQASSNFVDWTDIAILANTNGAVRFYDQDSASFNQRFYRVVAPN